MVLKNALWSHKKTGETRKRARRISEPSWEIRPSTGLSEANMVMFYLLSPEPWRRLRDLRDSSFLIFDSATSDREMPR